MKKMKVLPVYPEFPPSFWGFQYALKWIGKKSTMPPVGLATVAAMIPEERFECLPILDMSVEPLTDKQIMNSDIVLTSSMIVQKDSLDDVIKRAHKLGKPVVAGGPYPTTHDVAADYVVAGEAEITLAPFLNDLLNGTPRKKYTPETVRVQGNVALAPNGKPDITKTPVPRWDLLKLDAYESLAIQYSRGCPFNCDFCDITKLYGKLSRTKTTEQMINEFNAIYNLGWRGNVFIVDDNFIGNINHVKELLPVLTKWQKEHKYPFSFYTEASTNLGEKPLKDDVLPQMVEAGFDCVFLGIESFDDDVLKKMNKGQNRGDLVRRIKTIQNSGMEVMGGFIIGSDGEKEDVFDKLFDGIQETGIVTPMAGLLTALKGTELYKRLEKEGRILGESSGNNTHGSGFNFKTERNEEELIQAYNHLLSQLFNSKNYYHRCRTLLDNLGPSHSHPQSLSISYNAVKNVLVDNIMHPDAEFLKYFGYVLFNHPSKIPEAVSQTVKYHHFKTITNATFRMQEIEEEANTAVEGLSGSYESIKAKGREIRDAAYKKGRRIPAGFKVQLEGIMNSIDEKIQKKAVQVKS